MNPLLHNDIFIEICYRFDDIKTIIYFELLSKYHLNIIRNTIWKKRLIINNEEKINSIEILKHHKFNSLEITNDINIIPYLDSLSNCTCLYFKNSISLNDDVIKRLERLDTLAIDHCDNVTDRGLKCLSGLRSLYIEGCNQITDESIICLKKLNYLVLHNCNRITDESIKSLDNLLVLLLYECSKITHQSLDILTAKGCKVIKI